MHCIMDRYSLKYTQVLMREYNLTNLNLSSELLKSDEVNNYDIPYDIVNFIHCSILNYSSKEEVQTFLSNHNIQPRQLKHCVNQYGFTLLFFLKSPNVINYLNDEGVDLTKHSNGSNHKYCDFATPSATALHYAAYYKHDKAVKELIRLGANVNEKDEDGVTPLGYGLMVAEDLLMDLTKPKSNTLKDLATLMNLTSSLNTINALLEHNAEAIYFKRYSDRAVDKTIIQLNDLILHYND